MKQTSATSVLRIHVIDAIRGLAVFGILLANIQSWSGYKFMPLEGIEELPLYHLDALFNHLHYWLVDGKFYAIFSMLFGAGFGIQYLKHQQKQPPFISKYRRRLIFLLLFGTVHALFWSGDILTLYALLAFVLVLLRNIDFERILPLSILLLCAFALPQLLVLMSMEPAVIKPVLAHKTYIDMSPEVLGDAFGRGSWLEVFATNLHNIYWRWLDFIPNGRISRVLGLFVLGFYLSRSGYFHTGIYSKWQLSLYLILGIAATICTNYFNINITRWAVSGPDILMKMVLVAGQVFLALAYMSLLAQVFRRPLGERLLYPLTLIGRMAFTSYLSQTLVGITIFYGIGFGYWATMGLAQLWMVSVAIFAGQVLFCTLWLHYFKQGPVEWLWASLTNGQFRSNRRTDA
jgi:uncharacterized protein